ncbi:anosmin-1-like [Sarcophilus harrisii]
MRGEQGRRILGVLLLAGAAGVAAAGRAASRGVAERALFTARCSSRCLALHITHFGPAFPTLQNNEILTWCSNNRRCSQGKMKP